jgi:hypothetical protein
MRGVLYYAIQKNKDNIKAKIDNVPMVPLNELASTPAAKLVAQILHVKKSSRQPVNFFNKDRTKKSKGFYDRIIYFR